MLNRLSTSFFAHISIEMTSNQQTGLSSDRIRGPPGVKTDYVVCCICHDILWKPVACQSCETPFCSVCIHKWLASNPAKCPKRCPQYIERKCPPIVATMLAELQVSCLYQSNSCNQVFKERSNFKIFEKFL